MNKRLILSFLLLISGIGTEVGTAQETPLAYQGHLSASGNPANGQYEMQFTLFDTIDAGSGTPQGVTIRSPVSITNGLFNVILDFGAAVFNDPRRFLEVAVKPGGSAGPYTALTPRQQVTAVPYALHSVSASQLDANSAVGIGTATPALGVRLEVNGNTRITPGGSGGIVQVGTPNGETGLGVVGSNRFDLRFNSQTVTLAAGPGIGPPPSEFGITINTNGNVGIGLRSPLLPSQWKLEVNGVTRFTPGGSGGEIQFNTPNSETGMRIIGVNRSDLRFDGSVLKLVAGPGNSIPPAENGIAINTAGNVGIGTAAPISKLHVQSSADGKATVYGKADGENSVGVYGEAKTASSAGLWGRNPSGIAVYADGHAAQARDKSGFIKAMLDVRADGTIARCYNGIADVATGNCGFTIDTRVIVGSHSAYMINFGFKVNDRFISVTPHGSTANVAATFFVLDDAGAFGTGISENQVIVDTFLTDVDHDFSEAPTRFTIIVY